MAIGPYAGNGFEWDHGPFHLGVWNEPSQQGFGGMNGLGHKDPAAGWQIDADIESPGDTGAWQNLINLQTGGLQGAFWVQIVMPKVNANVDLLFPLNKYSQPGAPPIQNSDPYSLDEFNAIIALFTEADPVTGHLKQKGT